MAKKPTLLALVAVAAVAVVIPMTAFGLPYGRFNPEDFVHSYTFPDNGNETHLHIDADPTNGSRPCDPIDTTRRVQVGDTYDVALCLETYGPGSLETFVARVLYETNNDALDPDGDEEPANGGSGPDCGSCVDDNPDANDGDDATGFMLGGGWNCSGFGARPPAGDDPSTPERDAVLVCNADIIVPDADLTADPGLLGTLQFTATGVGTEFLSWSEDQQFGAQLAGTGLVLPGGEDTARCGDSVPDQQIPCFGATIEKVVYDCEWQDDFGRNTALALMGDEYDFSYPPSGFFRGTGQRFDIDTMSVMIGSEPGLLVLGFGTCPAGPGTAFAIDFSAFPISLHRVEDAWVP